MKSNVIQDKSYAFAIRIVKLYQALIKSGIEKYLCQQLLHSGTSIGANIEEAIGGQSDKDFLAKMSIAYKEARETKYWLRLFKDTDLLNFKSADSLLADCEELLKLLGAIQTTMKSKLSSKIIRNS